MKRRIVICVAAVAMAANAMAQVAAVPDTAELRKPFTSGDIDLFRNPPKIHYPQTWFHIISGNVSKEGLTDDLEAIAESGISGVQLFHGQFGGPWPGVDPQVTALSPHWDDMIAHAASEAKRLGLRFTMLNCSGWATAGGPWIEPSNAMRHLVSSRKDVKSGETGITLDVPQPSGEPWRDYNDIAVLAFPTPLDDTGKTLEPESVSGNYEDFPWKSFLSGKAGRPASLPPCEPGRPWTLDVTFADTVAVRTVELPSMNSINHPWCYEPGISIRITAHAEDGTETVVLDAEVPSSNSQDNTPISFACSDPVKASRKYTIEINNEHHMNLWSLKLYSGARKNCWQSEAGWTLRNLERENAHPMQNDETYIDLDDIVDLIDKMDSDGRLDWDVPAGDWTILRVGHVNTGRQNSPAPPEGTGWECNKLDPSGAEAQFAGYIGRLQNGALGGGLLDGLLIDSWECETQTWTRNMENEFASRNDYSLRAWLPAVLGYVVEDQETTACFLRDWRQTVSDLFTENFYGTMSRLANENGLTFTFETAAGDVFPADIMEYFKYADVPMCEFWQPFTDGFVGSINFKPTKPTASAAHLYGKPRVAAESFTSFSHTWDEHWDKLKEIADYHISEGVSHIVYHTYTHNPQKPYLAPGSSFGGPGIGTPFLRGQTWWKYMPEINRYFARCSYMQERGLPVSDILWYLGDEINGKPDQNPDFLKGYRYDYCNPDVLMNRLSVQDGCIVTPEGIRYSVLWLPDNCRMLPETLEKVLSLVKAGAVVIGEAPEYIATLNGGEKARKAFDRAVRKIWGKNHATIRKVGKGKVISGVEILAALKLLGIEQDVKGGVMWNHRRTDGADWYFVCTEKGKDFSGTLDFRCKGKVEIWNPMTGQRSTADAVQSGERTLVRLELPKSGACYVVFREESDLAEYAASKETGRTVLSKWTLSFPEGWGVSGSVKVDSLVAWKDLDLSDEGKAFSGTVTYGTTFTLEQTEGGRYVLELGDVDMIASVSVNGNMGKVLWAPPFSLDVTDMLKEGENTISVDVTGTWFNRLVYDARIPEKERKTWVIRRPGGHEPLRNSGLLGPVSLVRYDR